MIGKSWYSCLYYSQILLTLHSQFKIYLKAPILLGHPEKQKSVVGRELIKKNDDDVGREL